MLGIVRLILYLAASAATFFTVLGQTSVNPTWTPNSYFECKEATLKNDITTAIGSADPPINMAINFAKSYTAIPQLAFGIKNYRGIYSKNIGSDTLTD